MVAQYPGSHNVFVPDHAATNNLVVDFSRNPNDFPINQYVQIVPVEKVTGYYLEMTVEEAGRLITTDIARHAWPDGQDAPADWDGTEAFEFKDFRCRRYKFGTTLGDLTVDQSSWDITAQHAAIKAQQAMTARTQLAVTVLTTSGNYSSTHTAAVSAIAGNTGDWPASTTARQDIRRSLNHAANVIVQDTLAAVKPASLILVLSPGLAKEVSESQEIVDFIKGSPAAWASINGDLADQNMNAAYGLPPKLYGYDVVIENSVKVTTLKGATTSRSFILADDTPFMCAQPGGLEGLYGAPSFSTCSLFMKEEMTTERRHDADNRKTAIRVVENFDTVMTAPVSGFLFTSAT